MLLTVKGVTHRHPGGTRDVLRDVSFEVTRGESVALTGESGSGKSTLLHMLAALDHPLRGCIEFDGQDITALSDKAASQLRRSHIALVFQQFNLVPALSVADNIALHAKLGQRFDASWTEEVTARLGLSELVGRYPEQISGGQQQRVAIARALALRPDLLLADEPTGNLDETASAEVLRLMLDLVQDTGCALFLVTHSAAIAARCARHLHLSGGQVRVQPT
ncbi:ABC transporter ATP-binding protein [Tritonibacter mobilis]|uniref:ABC transporter ATP-binding protein n=1 Tax=Tritonibacter mobilis TaxID=379347 RepID=UPI001CD98F86|nr:ABC transporter ATP-binding protein [Tritonibacter mobilis]MCA2007177.1 ABC transporter ATP-binding protein [Tritonibacter mobilis]